MRALPLLLMCLAGCSVAQDVLDGPRLEPAAVRDLGMVVVGTEEALFAVAWRPDGKEVFAGGTQSEGLFFDVTDGTRLGALPFARGPIRSASYSRDGRRIAVGGSGFAGVWDVNDKHETATLFEVAANATAPASVAWSPTTDVLAVAGSVTDAVTLWGADGHLIRALTGIAGPCLSPVWSADGTKIAAVCGDKVGIWPAQNGGLLCTASAISNGKLYAVSWSGDGARLATAGADQNLYVVDAATCNVLQTLTGQPTPIASVAWHPQRDLVLAQGWDRGQNVHNHLFLWDVAKSELAGKLVDHSTGNTDVEWSPDGNLFATTSVDAVLKIRKFLDWGM